MKQFYIFLLVGISMVLQVEEGAAQNCNSGFSSVVSGCNVVAFTPDLANPTFSYLWDFGDGNTSTMSNPVHIFDSFGAGTANFTVKLTVSGPTCDTSMTSKVVTIQQVPDATIIDASGNDFLDCSQNGQLTITNGSTTKSTNVQYTIIWGDPGSMPPSSDTLVLNSFNTPQSHFYSTKALYIIKIIVKGSNGCINIDSIPFIWSAEPKVSVKYKSNNPLCIPDSARIEISDFENNTPDTKYFIRINDGSPGYTLNHPPPSVFYYPIDISSCDTITILNGITYNHAFQVLGTAITGCPGVTSTNADGPIRTRTEPGADFEINPFPVVCQDSIVKVNNLSTAGLFFINDNLDCANSMSVKWAISPNSGYTITQGSLTDSSGFCAIFNTPGNYSIRLIVENKVSINLNNPDPNCDADTLIKSICVVPNPQSNFTKSLSSGCVPLQDVFTNTSNTLNSCRPTTYDWSVEFVGSECGTMGDYEFINNTDSNSVNAHIQFNLPGKYYIRLLVTNDCGTSEKLDSVIVAGAPLSTITPIEDECGSVTITPTLESTNFCEGPVPTYIWTYPAPNAGTFPGPNPPTRTYSIPGVYTITLTTQGCSNTQATETFEVFPLPPIPQISANTPCPGESLVFTNLNSTGLSCIWTGPNGFTSTDCDPVISPVGPEHIGTYCLVVTNADGCTRERCISVNVLNAPPVVAMPDTSRICLGQSATLTATGANSFTWSPTTFMVPVSGVGANVVVTPPIGTYQYTVTGTNGLNCTNKDSVVVVVGPLQVVSITTPDTACLNVTLQLEGLPNSGGVGMWSVTPTSNVTITNTGAFTASLHGNYMVTYKFTDINGCQNSASTTICVVRQPSAQFIVNDDTGCMPSFIVSTTNQSNTLTDCLGARFTWDVQFQNAECHSGGGMWNYNSGNANSQSPVFNFTQSGVYTISLTVTNACGTSSTSRTITVGEAPKVEIEDIVDACDGVTIMPNALVTNCNSPVTSYNWQWPVNNSSSLQNPTITISGTGSYIISVTVNNECGTAMDTEEIIIQGTINSKAKLDTTFGCIPITIGVDNLSTGSVETYLWEVLNLDGTSATPPVVIANPAAAQTSFTFAQVGTYIVRLTASNILCGESVWQDTVLISDIPGVDILPIDDFCQGTGPINPTATYTDQVYIDQITWTFAGATTPVPPTSDQFIPGPVDYGPPNVYNISLTATNRCGTATDDETFQVIELLEAQAVLDTTFGCIPFTINVTNNTMGDFPTYLWEVFNLDGTSATPPVVIADPAAAQTSFTFAQVGTYIVRLTASNALCGQSLWQDTVLISDILDEPGLDLAVNRDTVTIGGTIFIINNNTEILSYLWTVTPATGVTISDILSPTPAFVFNGPQGTYTISADINSPECISIWQKEVVVLPFVHTGQVYVEPAIQLFPNPSNGNFMVRLSADIKPVQMELYDHIGQMLLRLYPDDIQSEEGYKIKFETKGAYCLRIVLGDQKSIVKNIVIH